MFEKVHVLPKISVSAPTKLVLGLTKCSGIILEHIGTVFELMMAIVMLHKAQKLQISCEKV